MEQNHSASWADFAIALLTFAREDPWGFALTLFVIAVFVVFISVPVVWVVPKVEAMYRARYTAERERNKLPELFNGDS